MSKTRLKSKAARHMDSPSQSQSEVPRHSIQQGVKGATASWCAFVALPPEIFSEILANLSPADLLSLARTSKVLRRFLMSRTSRHSWQMVLNHIQYLPLCPPDMCEPQYASLLFSETCSTCGIRVFRSIDPVLRVRLCHSCFSEQTIIVDLYNPKDSTNLVPKSHGSQSDSFGWTAHSHLYTLRSELKYVRGRLRAASSSQDTLKEWRDARTEEMRKRREHAAALRKYLDQLDVIRERELDKQEAVVKGRLTSVGWSYQDVSTAPANLQQWRRLVHGPDPLSATSWAKIYPQLVLIMWSNRAHHRRKGWKTRQDQYIAELYRLATDIRECLPLLHRVMIQPGSDRHSKIPALFPIAKFKSNGDQDPSRRDIAQLFPSMVELQELPIIRDLLAKDIGIYSFRSTLQGCRHKVEQAIEGWRIKVEEELLSILNLASNNSASDNPKATNLQIANPVQYLNIRPPGSLDDTTIPKVTIIFPQPNLTCTSNISLLRPTIQTLLRADSRFIRDNVSGNYPFVCFPEHRIPPFSINDKRSYGIRWNADSILPDPQGALICRRLLADLGRPNATHAELSIVGNNYKCGRCGYPPTIWEVLVGHYRDELDRWEQVASVPKKKNNSSCNYRNLHDLNSRPDKPLIRMVSPKEAHETLKLNHGRWVDRRFCNLCSQLGLAPHSYRFISGDKECALLSHLRDVHDEYWPILSTFRRDMSD